jgi:putative FmdB family regulatory protein
MPIYAYKCESCGFAKDVLQKMSDTPLDTCPSCARATFKKQVTAAGFQLKGAGWYVTDFKGGNSAGSAAATASAAAEKGADDGAAAPAKSNETAAPKAETAAGGSTGSATTTATTNSTPPAASGT